MRFGILISLMIFSLSGFSEEAKAKGFLHWRGAGQAGVVNEVDLPASWDVEKGTLWSLGIKAQGTPVVANERVYSFGYVGEKEQLREVLSCIDLATGKIIWQQYFSDFLSDVIYDRYSIGSPTVDPETGNVYVLTAPGLFLCFSSEGKELWRISMMEVYGWMTFPNGRVGSPVVYGDLIIVQGVTGNWGKDGPPKSRFYAFDKNKGSLVWSSTSGLTPKDNSFSPVVIGEVNGRHQLFSGIGCGFVVGFDAATGKPIWRYPITAGGVNGAVVLYKDMVIAVHGTENLDNSTSGRLVAVRIPKDLKPSTTDEPVVLDRKAEVWRQNISSFSSSPVLVKDRLYQVDDSGSLHCVNVETGEVLWVKKLGSSQIHASPIYGDGKLYVPIYADNSDDKSTSGLFYILKPTDQGCEVLTKVRLEGKCLGAPAIYGGRVLIHTDAKLYCFGASELRKPTNEKYGVEVKAGVGAKVAERIVFPAEVLLKPGEKASFECRELDENGKLIRVGQLITGKWEAYVPATAKVKSTMKGEFKDGLLVASTEVVASAGAYRFIGEDGLSSVIRARVVPVNYSEDFESFNPTVPRPEANTKYDWPPLAWIGARFKWEIREIDGNKCLVKVHDRLILQRAMTFIGYPEMKDYTIEADVMTAGNRRSMSDVGVINQRYIISMKGSHKSLEISSNLERMQVTKPFPVQPNSWYRLKTKVKSLADGSGVIYVKCWLKSEKEPEEWTMEQKVERIHDKGAPGLYGFSPGGLQPVFIDNVKVSEE